MKRIFISILVLASLFSPVIATAATTADGLVPLGPNRIAVTAQANVTSFVIDAANHQIAWKFFASSTSAITHVDALLNAVGNTSGCTFTFRIETDSSGSPSGTIMGATNNAITSGFAGPASSTAAWWAGGGTNPIALAESTGTLTINTPYWLILKETGTDPDGSNYLQATRLFAGGRNYVKIDDGSSAWTHATAALWDCPVVLKDAANNYHQGVGGYSAMANMTTATAIYDANKQGLKFRVGSEVLLSAITVNVKKQGSPTNLVIKVYKGSTLLATETITAAYITTLVSAAWYFTTPQWLDPDTDYYIVLLQAGTDETDGGDSSNYYALQVSAMHPTYYTAVFPVDAYNSIYGTSTDPTALTVHATKNNVPMLQINTSNIIDGLDIPASTGGGGAWAN